MISRRSSKFSGMSAKSFACQPDANERPTRPPERLSTTDHSSATRIGIVQREDDAARADCDSLA